MLPRGGWRHSGKRSYNMFRKQRFLILAVGFASISLPAFSQEGELRDRNEAAVQVSGSFVKSTLNNGVQQDATNSGGVLASYRFFFTNHHGVEVNYGYALNTQTYALTSGTLGVKSRAHEASAAYVFRFPRRRWSPFAL